MALLECTASSETLVIMLEVLMSKERERDKELAPGLMDLLILASGKTVCDMAKEFILSKMAQDMKECGSKIESKDKVNYFYLQKK